MEDWHRDWKDSVQTKLPTAIIVDIDGTVAQRTGRSPYDYSLVSTDIPKPEVVEVVRSLWMAGHKIIFVSGRKAVCKEDTYNWLIKYCPPFISMYMRKDKDNRPDTEIKKEIYEEHIKGKYQIICAIDDRQRIVDMWREEGLVCMQVDVGDF